VHTQRKETRRAMTEIFQFDKKTARRSILSGASMRNPLGGPRQ
jgi:hypothetical protein